jgi:hypothetical protein
MALGKSFPKAHYSHGLFGTPPMGLTGASRWARPPLRAALPANGIFTTLRQARRAGMRLSGSRRNDFTGLFSAGVEGFVPLPRPGRNPIAPS